MKHLLIVGQTGSGKTSLARQLLQLTPRAVIIDPQDDYTSDPGVERFSTFAAWSAEFLKRHETDSWRLAYSPDAGQVADGGFRSVMALTYRARMAMRDGPSPDARPQPIGVFLEESSIYSDASATPAELDWLVRAGRKAGIGTVSVVQTDVDISKAVRRNVSLTIMLRSHRPSLELRRIADPETLAKLETLQGPAMKPVAGTHFVTDPPGTDPHDYWRGAVDP